MLYDIIVRIINRGALEGLAEKVDVFYAYGKLTEEQYTSLTEMIGRG